MGVLAEYKAKDYATFIGTFCGILAIVLAISYEDYDAACFTVMIGMAADVLDGYIARRTQTFNELGKELDSLSDFSVFGVAPAIVAYHAYTNGLGENWTLKPIEPIVMIIPTFIFILGAISRLAWFNVREEEGYEGLPTPLTASALCLIVLADYFSMVYYQHSTWFNVVCRYFVPILMVLLAYFNITEKIMYGQKVRKKSGSLKYVFIILVVAIGVLIVLSIARKKEAAVFILSIVGILFILLLTWIGYGFRTGFRLRKKAKKEHKMEQAA